ncbi:21 kDa protein-like [Macadamia integrifolia]|uniref:21 kDa protein-like n=1 Tax=Macadamia integrifolia TaxID=60698 RepID=UPI001C4E42C7|nr:21 kDa protein-like [Macadamia integrifolia]
MEMKGFRSSSPFPYPLMATSVIALLVLSSNIKNCLATNTSYIKSSCASTRYAKLCYSSLSAYASTVGTNHTKLAIVALNVSLSATQNTSALVTEMSNRHGMMINETNAIKDCVYEVGDAICELQQSLEEMKVLGGSDFEYKKNSIETWVSAALTDDETYLDGMDGYNKTGKVEKSIRKSVKNTARLTSNALEIVDCLTQD